MDCTPPNLEEVPVADQGANQNLWTVTTPDLEEVTVADQGAEPEPMDCTPPDLEEVALQIRELNRTDGLYTSRSR